MVSRLAAIAFLLFGSGALAAPGGGDDTPALEAAISAAASSGRNTLRLPAARYHIRRPLRLPSGFRLHGAGPTTVITAVAPMEALIQLRGVTGNEVTGLVLEGELGIARRVDYGIDLQGAHHVRLERLEVRSVGSHGIVLRAGSHHCELARILVEKAGCGIVLADAADCTLKDVVVRRVDRLTSYMGALYLDRTRRIQVSDSTFEESNANGVFIDRSADVWLLRCVVSEHGSSSYGINRPGVVGGRGVMTGMGRSPGLVVWRCRIARNAEQAIFVPGAVDAVIAENRCLDNNLRVPGGAILEAGEGSKTLVGNLLSGATAPGTKGIFVSGPGNRVVANRITAVTSHGIQAWGVQDTLIAGNTVDGCGAHGLDVNFDKPFTPQAYVVGNRLGHGPRGLPLHVGGSSSRIVQLESWDRSLSESLPSLVAMVSAPPGGPPTLGAIRWYVGTDPVLHPQGWFGLPWGWGPIWGLWEGEDAPQGTP